MLSSSYLWTNQNGDELGTQATLQLLEGTVDVDDTLTCTATIDDGFTTTSDSTSSLWQQSSNLVETTITPNPAQTQDVLTCSGTDPSDFENDPISFAYLWTINDVAQDETTDTLLGPFAPNDEIGCTVTPSDEYSDGVSESTTLTVNSTPPTINALSINPTAPTVSSTLTCVAQAPDVDGDEPVLTTAGRDENLLPVFLQRWALAL